MTLPQTVPDSLALMRAVPTERAFEPEPLSTNVFSRWGETMSSKILTLQAQNLQPSEHFSGQACIARFHRCVVADIHSSAHRVMRTRALASEDQDRYFKVIWQIQGRNLIEHNGHSVTIDPGQWTIYDTSRPYSVETSNGSRFMVLLVPVSEMGRWNPGIEFVTGKVLPTRGTAEIARSALSGMLSGFVELEQQGAIVMQDSISALIGTAVAQIHGSSPKQDGAISQRLQKVQAFIEGRLTEPELSPELVARECGMSRRSLYAAFNALGQTPSSYIMNRRLAVAAQRLVEQSERTTITQVAFELGFSDAAHFSRVFSEKFGQSPSRWRNQQIAGH